MNCFSHLCYFPNTNGILKRQMGIFWVDYTHFPFFSVEIIRFFWRPTKWCKGGKRISLIFQSRHQFSFCVHQTTIGQNQHHIHTCRKFLISLQQRVPSGMQTLGTWRATQNKILRAPQLTCCIPAKNLHLKACACDSLPSAQPWAFKLGFGKSTNGGPASRLWPMRTPAHVPGVAHLTLSGMLSQVPSKATELESTF